MAVGFPGLALAVTIFGFSLIGSSVEVLADPVRRQRLARANRRQARLGRRGRGVEAPGRCFPISARRLIFVGPQLVGILLVSFLLLKLIPGDPAVMMLGPFATRHGLARLRSELGFDRRCSQQFGLYLCDVAPR